MTFAAEIHGFASHLREFIRVSTKAPNPACGGAPTFEGLALELFGIQFRHNRFYQALCLGRRFTPEDVKTWTDIPAVPVIAFKEYEVTCLPPEERTRVFHSSGTTEHRPSRHFHNRLSLAIYEASLLSWFRPHLIPGYPGSHSAEGAHQPATVLSLTPAPAEVPHSSLVYMFETIRQRFGSDDSVYAGRVAGSDGWTFDPEAAFALLQRAVSRRQPVALLGTAFSCLQLLDELDRRRCRFQLPPGSRLMETGGYKGRSRVLPKATLYRMITERLGLPSSHLISEYGMSELSSQAYDSVVGVPPAQTRRFRFPPWARARVISPETGEEVPDGEGGLLRVVDLANVGSVLALQTEDLVIRRGDGFEFTGRAEMAEPRGCSLMTA